ncbi:MAG: nitroreductase family protein [Pseudomonadales bacterium]|nr:nitroreductase family protein [Pseudomonadales bacterium]
MMSKIDLPPNHDENSVLSVPSAIMSRRSVRHYTSRPVPDELLDYLVELTLQAPSSWNLQDRHLVILRSQEKLLALAEATGGQPQPQEAPVMIVFVADLSAHKRDCSSIWDMALAKGAWSSDFAELVKAVSPQFQKNLEEKGLLREYAIKDAMIAASFFMLAATSLGLNTSPMNGWDEQAVKQTLDISHRDDLAIALLVSLGYAKNHPINPGRQEKKRNVFYESMA